MELKYQYGIFDQAWILYFPHSSAAEAAALFRTKFVGVDRRVVRIVERTSRYLVYRLFLHQIEDSLTPFYFVPEDQF